MGTTLFDGSERYNNQAVRHSSELENANPSCIYKGPSFYIDIMFKYCKNVVNNNSKIVNFMLTCGIPISFNFYIERFVLITITIECFLVPMYLQ